MFICFLNQFSIKICSRFQKCNTMLLPSSEYTISISIWTNKEVFDKGTNATNVMRDALGRHDVATVALGNGETQLEETI